jgi:hypothetical protein
MDETLPPGRMIRPVIGVVPNDPPTHQSRAWSFGEQTLSMPERGGAFDNLQQPRSASASPRRIAMKWHSSTWRRASSWLEWSLEPQISCAPGG